MKLALSSAHLCVSVPAEILSAILGLLSRAGVETNCWDKCQSTDETLYKMNPVKINVIRDFGQLLEEENLH